MTELTQTLEKLAELDGDFVEIEKDESGEIVGIYMLRKGTMRKCLLIGGLDEDRIFGAICEKIEADEWIWLKQARNLQIIDPDQDYKIIGDSRLDDGLTTAAAKALLAALEAKQSGEANA